MELLEYEFTDLFITPGDYSMRVEGLLIPITEPDWIEECHQLFTLCQNRYSTLNSPDFRLVVKNVSFRCVALESIQHDERCACFVIRKLPSQIFSWNELRLSHSMLCEILYGKDEYGTVEGKLVNRGGIIFVIGETDSGKSTTLNALIYEIATRQSWLFMTFEDPVETLLPNNYESGARIIQRDIVSSELVEGLKTALRANADVVKVGEIRDKNSARLAVDASLAGHTVMVTIHASSIADGLTRFSNLLGDDRTLLAQSFRCCIHQTLSKWNGIDSRIMNYLYLHKTQAVANYLLEGKFKSLEYVIESQTQAIRG